jgi:hypothetical protein
MTQLATSTPESRPGELLRAVTNNFYRDALAAGKNPSLYLEDLDPSSDHPDTKLDAFGRLLRAGGIRVKSIEEAGVQADPLKKMEDDEHARALIPELIARFWRSAVTGKSYNTRAVYTSQDQPPGTAYNPYAYASQPRFQQIAPAIPLSELIAFNTGISQRVYQAFYLTNDAENQRMKRVAEAGEIPTAKLVGGNHMIQLHKYGRKLETSYEVLRQMPIDLVAFQIQRMAVQAEADKVSTIVSILVSGDGNANTAGTVYNLTALDPAATAGTLTLKGWLAFKMLFANPYMMTTALAQTGVVLSMQLLNTGSANVPLFFISAMGGYGGFRAINPGLADNVAVGWTADAPALEIVALDKRFAVERVYEIGASIQEVEKWAARQVEYFIMTETEAYDILDPAAVKILNVNA